ncbi:MAG TPA: TonB family protein [Acidobacteriota bacterium]|nr:TonB family protein [Acidobacteriota bacterium]
MEAIWIDSSLNYNAGEPNWSKMLLMSLLFHLAIFSIILFVPEAIPTRRITGTVYEVNLVEMPGRSLVKAEKGAEVRAGKALPGSKRVEQARQISVPKREEKPVVIAKRTLAKRIDKAEKPKISSSKLIDEALSKIENKVKAEKKKEEVDPLKQAISKLESKARIAAGRPFDGGAAGDGITLRIYQMEVEEKIKSNWSYPVAFSSAQKQEGLQAVVVVKVRSNGTILESRFKKRSNSAMFDQSVLRALERSDPLPPFPEGYNKTREEIEITFNLKELEEY